MAAGLVAGVGFLGAGAILRTDERVRGLTTAAGIWVTAAIGLLIGSGFWILGMGVTGLALIIIVGLRPLHESVKRPGDETNADHRGSDD
jgi:putative Mg2+ transporter-C (MgtC) family protein